MSCGRLKLSKEEEKELRTLILSMVDEPLVRVIKLADRPHNMRTLYALKPAKQRAIWYRIWSPNWGEGRGDAGSGIVNFPLCRSRLGLGVPPSVPPSRGA